MRIGVTGGSGFIGSFVVEALDDASHDVMVLDLVTPRSAVEHRPVDLMDGEALKSAMAGLDVVFHLAAYADVNDVVRDPVGAIDLNVGGTLRVLEAARANSLRRVFLASTVWVYSSYKPQQDGEVVDETVLIAIDASRHIYTSSKLAAELLCHDYWNMYQLPFTVLRYGIPYGPRMRPSLVIPLFVNKVLAGEPLTITGDGSQHRKFVFVEDLARGHVLALTEAARNQTINLDGNEKVTILRIAETVQRLAGSQMPLQFLPARAGDYSGVDVSSDRARQLLGWEPRVDFEAGMQRTVAWLMAQAAELATPP